MAEIRYLLPRPASDDKQPDEQNPGGGLRFFAWIKTIKPSHSRCLSRPLLTSKQQVELVIISEVIISEAVTSVLCSKLGRKRVGNQKAPIQGRLERV